METNSPIHMLVLPTGTLNRFGFHHEKALITLDWWHVPRLGDRICVEVTTPEGLLDVVSGPVTRVEWMVGPSFGEAVWVEIDEDPE